MTLSVLEKRTIALEGGLTERIAGEDIENNRLVTEEGWTPYTISTADTFLVCDGPGKLRLVKALAGTLGNVTIYNALTATGTPVIPALTPDKGEALVDVAITMSVGITIVTAAATILLVAFRKDV